MSDLTDDFDSTTDDTTSYDTYDTYDSGIDPTASTMAFDADGDGYAESALIDSTGDGIADTLIEEDPYTGGMSVATDTDGDGIIDTVAVDYDGDGLIDDAIVDETSSYSDGPFTTDADVVDVEGDTTDVDDLLEDVEGDLDEETDTTDLDVTDVTTDVDDGIHGDPQADIEFHQTQPGPVDCVPTSVAMVLSEMTGEEVSADEVVAMANESGFMMESGMMPEDALTLFQNYGVDAELQTGTIDDLRAALDTGDPVVIGLDSADLYNGGGGPFDPGMEAGHAVVLTGIDDGPPGVVYINDPGFPDGAGVEIPLDQFIDAWQDSDNTMIVAEAGGEGEEAAGAIPHPEGEETTDSGTEEDRSGLRMLLLPLNFIVGA